MTLPSPPNRHNHEVVNGTYDSRESSRPLKTSYINLRTPLRSRIAKSSLYVSGFATRRLDLDPTDGIASLGDLRPGARRTVSEGEMPESTSERAMFQLDR